MSSSEGLQRKLSSSFEEVYPEPEKRAVIEKKYEECHLAKKLSMAYDTYGYPAKIYVEKTKTT